VRILRATLAAATLGTVAVAWWWRKNPSACPYNQRFWVQAPHPGITRARLLEILDPLPGERILEVGPGTGYYTLDVAERVGAGGAGGEAGGAGGEVAVFDIQQEMLDHTMREAAKRGLENVTPTLGDAQSLPYEDSAFDAAYLVTVLGEIPDPDAALRELARVLKPGGRLVVGELFGDPHMVTLGAMRERAARAGLAFERRLGNALAFFARFTRPV
jgi:ubiquinone/menaquinone biosynthesis C-methylase UbiE